MSERVISAAPAVLADTDIKIGEHVTGKLFGLTFNVDTIWTTAVAGAIVIGLGLLLRRSMSDTVPSKIQIMWEAVVNEVTAQVEGNLGKVNPFVVPLALALFVFILISNWLELIPSGEDPKILPAPTADINLTLSLAALVIVSVWVYGVRTQGAKNYVKHFVQPYPALLPLNILEEIAKPFTLALRLFGNIFAGGIMIALIGLLPVFTLWAPNIIWKLFDMFIGVIQAFIFGLLTILYFGAATGHAEEHDDAPSSSDDRQPSAAT
jgi:F-type H+-transporting ATPase subunit a